MAKMLHTGTQTHQIIEALSQPSS